MLWPTGAPGLYLHVPFCRSKCTYCDFSSFVGLEALFGDYVSAVTTEAIGRAGDWRSQPFDSIFIGGGTPTVLGAQLVLRLIETFRRVFPFADNPEITLEANPGTVSFDDLLATRHGGVNRLSLGVQSLWDDELRLLGRIHSAKEAIDAIHLARQAGFDNLNLDLIFGLPQQTLAHWREMLRRALDTHPEHLSLYCLTLEEGTPMAEAVRKGLLDRPDEGAAAEMYELSETLARERGMMHYEISNWARSSGGLDPDGIPLLACQHNLKYWRNQHYLGLGSGAHSFDGRSRYANIASPQEYIARILAGGSPEGTREATTPTREMGETMMLGLRLLVGVTGRAFQSRFGVGLYVAYRTEITELVDEGLLQRDDLGIRLTPRGRLLGNRVFAALLR